MISPVVRELDRLSAGRGVLVGGPPHGELEASGASLTTNLDAGASPGKKLGDRRRCESA